MKRLSFLLFAMFVLCLPGFANATGEHVEGYVNVYTNFMYGTMNNRYSTIPTGHSTLISASGTAAGTVNFYGRDGDGDTFSCFVPVGNALHMSAVAIMNNMRNGSYLYAQKDSSVSNECTGLFYVNGSHMLD